SRRRGPIQRTVGRVRWHCRGDRSRGWRRSSAPCNDAMISPASHVEELRLFISGKTSEREIVAPTQSPLAAVITSDSIRSDSHESSCESSGVTFRSGQERGGCEFHQSLLHYPATVTENYMP